MAASPPVEQPVRAAPAPPSKAEKGKMDGQDELGDFKEDAQESDKAKRVEIADPLEPFNRAMYEFNDKMYFWVLKPVARGYSTVVPEKARVGVDNFLSNMKFPIRFINSLLQADFGAAATEVGRFMVNTIWGIGGLLDPASGNQINLAKQDRDFGQTLGVYGVGQGFYINWPILGPSSPRDTVGLAGDYFLQPSAYLDPWTIWLGIKAYEKVNSTSLVIGDYESLKEAAIDPYVAIRDAYVQYRLKKVKGVKTLMESPRIESADPATKKEVPAGTVPAEPEK
jgi:phospholipid-binding lipoprotein MlaA